MGGACCTNLVRRVPLEPKVRTNLAMRPCPGTQLVEYSYTGVLLRVPPCLLLELASFAHQLDMQPLVLLISAHLERHLGTTREGAEGALTALSVADALGLKGLRQV
jgi:hypothetical protein